MISNTQYEELFRAFEKAPMEEFMEVLLSPLPSEKREPLMFGDVSFHRYSAEKVSLEAWISLAPFEEGRWIWAVVELDQATGFIEEMYYTRGNYKAKPFRSLEEAIESFSAVPKRKGRK